MYLDGLDLAAAVLHLLLEAGAVRPGLRQDVQGRDARPVQAARDGLPHLLVRRAVPAPGARTGFRNRESKASQIQPDMHCGRLWVVDCNGTWCVAQYLRRGRALDMGHNNACKPQFDMHEGQL